MQTELGFAPVAVEFFAGIGLARLGLERAGFNVTWSNDIEPTKRDMYTRHFKDPEEAHTFVLGDVGAVKGDDLPSGVSLAWASSPCVDVSLAGARAGLVGARSATFFEFTRVLRELDEADRPDVVTLENVVGLATSHGGKDLAAAIAELNDLGYSVDVLTLDARWFVPQSRPRLFLVGARFEVEDEPDNNPQLRPAWLRAPFFDTSLKTHRAPLPPLVHDPPGTLASVRDKDVSDNDPRWWDAARTVAFEGSLSPIQAKRLAALREARSYTYRSAYRRTRNGTPMWEIRNDAIAGCLRTARGGSSKQALVKVGYGKLRVRWMTEREYARLMGADDYDFATDIKPNQALFGFGDAVCVPAVAWLAENYLMPLINGKFTKRSTEKLAALGA
jgi:DNA (cytosine-5)-methyltransferase 1